MQTGLWSARGVEALVQETELEMKVDLCRWSGGWASADFGGRRRGQIQLEMEEWVTAELR